MITRVDVDAWVHLYVIELASNTKWLEKKMARIDGSLVFERT